jgi:hypothetical protein
MTQAFNLSQLANKVNSSGQLDGSTGIVNDVPSATTTTNITGGTKGQVPVQSAAGATTFMDSSFGFKNRIINGAMVIDQRNAGASITVTNAGLFSVDRWETYGSPSSKFSAQQNAGSVTPPVGFKNYLGCTSLSAYTLGATDQEVIDQAIEGLNVYDLAWGTANAQPITISFWVRSSLTGTFGGSVQNSAANRCYPYSYTISSANTWEYKTITIAGDTTGTWLTTNGVGLRLYISLGTGSTYSATSGVWGAGPYITAPTGATSVVGTNGATFYITGVQLEKGSTATSFDYRPYTTELSLCQRYFWILKQLDTAGGYTFATGAVTQTSDCLYVISNPVQMRTAPTITQSGQSTIYSGSSSATKTSLAASYTGSVISRIQYGSSFTGGASTWVDWSAAGANLTFSSEL